MNKKHATPSNGIYSANGKYYMMCGDNNYEIEVRKVSKGIISMVRTPRIYTGVRRPLIRTPRIFTGVRKAVQLVQS